MIFVGERNSMNDKIKLDGIVEIHITSVCNLNCKNCNRFSNYKFKGFERWEDYKEIYTKWANKVDFKKLTLIGGEPMLNPTFIDWFKGVKELWPDAIIEVCTNGTRLDKVPGFYDEVLKHKDKTIIDVNIHHKNVFEYTTEVIKNFLQGALSTEHDPRELLNVYDTIKGEAWPDSITCVEELPQNIKDEIVTNFNDRFLLEPCRYTDENGVVIGVTYSTFFNSVAVKNNNNKNLSLYNSDPKQAHDVCFSKRCHTFYKGIFYKCPVTALLGEFIDQHTFELSNSDRHLINNPDRLDCNASIEQIQEFWENIEYGEEVAQCKFCPANLETASTEAVFK